MRKSVSVDFDVLEIIEDFTNQAKFKNIDVQLISDEMGKNGSADKAQLAQSVNGRN